MRIRRTLTMEVPVERVFAFLADPDNRPRWQSSLRTVERLTAGPLGVGTRWRERPLGLSWVELEIVRFEKDSVWAERSELPFGTFELTLTFAAIGAGGTRVDVDAELALRGPAKLLGLGARAVLTPAMVSDLRRAERLLRAA